MNAVLVYLMDEIDEDYQDEVLSTLCRRRILRDKSNPLEMDEVQFLKNFRLSREVFKIVLDDLETKLSCSYKTNSVPNILKFACLLRFLSQGSYQLSVGNDYNLGLSQPTVCVILKELLSIFDKYMCPKWIKFGTSREEETQCKLSFYEKSGFPGVIGCIDGTHIKIRAPEGQSQHLYYNRKGFFSLNVMIVCNYKMEITYINARFPGSAHDSFIWNLSPLKRKLEEDFRKGKTQKWLLGDTGYPLAPFLITPFRATIGNSAEARFNEIHSKTRNVIERTIGVWKNRFRSLLGARELHYKPEKATQIVNACAALHNICIRHGIPFIDDISVNVAIEEDNAITLAEAPNILNREGETVRNRLLSSLGSSQIQ